MTSADSHSSSSADLEAAIERVQSWPDRIASLEAEVELLQAKNTYLLSRLTYHCNRGDALQAQLAAQAAVVEAALPVYGWYHRHVVMAHSVNPDTVTLPTSLLTPIWTALRPHYDPDAAIARLDAVDVPASQDDGWRRVLWAHHGHSGPALYGDDGELQCHACPLDFKRDGFARIEARLTGWPDAAAAPMAHTTSVSSGGVECCQTCFAVDVPSANTGEKPHMNPDCGLCQIPGCPQHSVQCTATDPHTRERHLKGKPYGNRMMPQSDHPHAALDLRAIDALVHVNVMGKSLPKFIKHDDRSLTSLLSVPSYTQSWDAAGLVIERLAQSEPPLYLSVSRRRDGWNASVWKYCTAHGDRCEALDRPVRLYDLASGPLAICLAALAALGVDVPA